ncbi:hypothetical protein OG239_03255 [Streptomyces sp. NBC_00868]|nr:hypothetical protein OG239_03255 [Streptomyces sp. NBC_00868]
MDILSTTADLLTALASAFSIAMEIHRARRAARTDDDGSKGEGGAS